MSLGRSAKVSLPPFTLEDLRKSLDRLALKAKFGCGNHGCVILPPKGMGTNSSCTCSPRAFARSLRQLADAVDRAEINWGK